jgi:hypothetical protein
MAVSAVALPGSSGLIGPTVAAATSEVGGGTVHFMGARVCETAGTPALAYVTFREGSATGKIIYSIKTAASGQGGEMLQDAVICNGQLYYKIEAGAVTGTAYIA